MKHSLFKDLNKEKILNSQIQNYQLTQQLMKEKKSTLKLFDKFRTASSYNYSETTSNSKNSKKSSLYDENTLKRLEQPQFNLNLKFAQLTKDKLFSQIQQQQIQNFSSKAKQNIQINQQQPQNSQNQLEHYHTSYDIYNCGERTPKTPNNSQFSFNKQHQRSQYSFQKSSKNSSILSSTSKSKPNYTAKSNHQFTPYKKSNFSQYFANDQNQRKIQHKRSFSSSSLNRLKQKDYEQIYDKSSQKLQQTDNKDIILQMNNYKLKDIKNHGLIVTGQITFTLEPCIECLYINFEINTVSKNFMQNFEHMINITQFQKFLYYHDIQQSEQDNILNLTCLEISRNIQILISEQRIVLNKLRQFDIYHENILFKMEITSQNEKYSQISIKSIHFNDKHDKGQFKSTLDHDDSSIQEILNNTLQINNNFFSPRSQGDELIEIMKQEQQSQQPYERKKIPKIRGKTMIQQSQQKKSQDNNSNTQKTQQTKQQYTPISNQAPTTYSNVNIPQQTTSSLSSLSDIDYTPKPLIAISQVEHQFMNMLDQPIDVNGLNPLIFGERSLHAESLKILPTQMSAQQRQSTLYSNPPAYDMVPSQCHINPLNESFVEIASEAPRDESIQYEPKICEIKEVIAEYPVKIFVSQYDQGDEFNQIDPNKYNSCYESDSAILRKKALQKRKSSITQVTQQQQQKQGQEKVGKTVFNVLKSSLLQNFVNKFNNQ